MSYDVKCYELAQAFAEDLPKRLQTEESISELAQVIQDAIENWWPSEEDQMGIKAYCALHKANFLADEMCPHCAAALEGKE